MGVTWKSLLQEAPMEKVLPWTGGHVLVDRNRIWRLEAIPAEHGWYRFSLGPGKSAKAISAAEPDLLELEPFPHVRGILVGNRLLPHGLAAFLPIERIPEAADQVFLADPTIERFSSIIVARLSPQRHIFVGLDYAAPSPHEVVQAFEDRRDLSGIKAVPPALDLAFRWENWRRDAREAALVRAQHEASMHLTNQLGFTAGGRRALARTDFASAARTALQEAGAVLLDVRPGVSTVERVVTFRHLERRFECVVHAETLRVIDSGICLVRYETDESGGDDLFTLESLPGVIEEAIRTFRLHVYRHVGS